MNYAGQQLFKLGGNAENLTESLEVIHRVIVSRYPDIDRMALAIYDAPTDMLKTFASSNLHGAPLIAHEAKLSQVPSLLSLKITRQSRLVRNIQESFTADTVHTNWLKENGYRSSYTVPVFQGNDLACFLFFDSKSTTAFDQDAIAFLEVFANLIAQLYLLQLRTVHGLIGMVHLASSLARVRDVETGNHLERMACYSRLIAKKLAHSHHLSDEFIEYVHLFAPLHDIGKIGIPDQVLLKPGQLNQADWSQMQKHVEIGEQVIEQIIFDMGLSDDTATRVMRNIVSFHHERGNGSGYPRHLQLAQIPLEARIVAVADVYDALSSQRPYKPVWNENQILQEFQNEVAAGRLDGDCVSALMSAQAERLEIQMRFADAN